MACILDAKENVNLERNKYSYEIELKTIGIAFGDRVLQTRHHWTGSSRFGHAVWKFANSFYHCGCDYAVGSLSLRLQSLKA